jgi:cytochrome c oxidase assembly protein subunit 15
MGMLFIAQAAMGWYMVASGLVDRPSVSHIRLTLHLLLALSLFGLALWTAFGHQFGFPARVDRFPWSLPSKLALWSFAVLLIQISYGGMTAGLKAGHVSDTWPRMFGRWIPPNLFDAWTDFIETPQTIVFIHRWLAWLGILLVPPVWFLARRLNYPREIRSGLAGLTALVAAQILLGILTILTRVQIAVALIHQAYALALFALAVFFIHRFRALDRSST